MTARALRVGISAIFDPRRTAHARTFLRAIAVAVNHLPGVAALDLRYADDGADGVRAAAVARQFRQQRVDLVLGHFSSDAAAVAAGVYARHGIPLLLPAATATMLTAQGPQVFRVCASDAMLAERLVGHAQARGWRSLSLEHDGSLHGRLLVEAIGASARRAGLTVHDGAAAAAEAAVFAGRLAPSGAFVASRRAAGDARPLLLTDDAVSQHLFDGIAAPGDVTVLGFPCTSMVAPAQTLALAHRRMFGTAPDMYFLESCAALAIAAQLAAGGGDLAARLRSERFSTPAGAIAFHDGERRAAPHAVWRAHGRLLQPSQLIDV